jgi:inner membrane transporter RhtA
VAVVVGAVILSQALPPTALVAVALVTIAAIGVNITDRRGTEIAPPPSG